MNAVPVRHHNSHRHGFRRPAPILRPAEASLVARTARTIEDEGRALCFTLRQQQKLRRDRR